jgi:hypothetical protein
MTAHEKSTYIVQKLEDSADGEGERWQDIGTVVIPTRQRRSSAIKAAVENAASSGSRSSSG